MGKTFEQNFGEAKTERHVELQRALQSHNQSPLMLDDKSARSVNQFGLAARLNLISLDRARARAREKEMHSLLLAKQSPPNQTPST